MDWNTLSEKEKKNLRKKKVVFVPGGVQISLSRLKILASDNIDLNIDLLIVGCLKDKAIPGLEKSIQFEPMRKKQFEKYISKLEARHSLKIKILEHFHKDTKYIIKELKPVEVIFINGSWKGQIHYRSEYWKALRRKIDVKLISPFSNEEEALDFEAKVGEKNQSKLEELVDPKKKYSDDDLLKLAQKVSYFSWDWIGQTGSVLAKNGKVLTFAWNRVVPFESYQMLKGSLRERLQVPAQEMIETQMTNHAEMEIFKKVIDQGIDLKNSVLYLNLFPCPVCAKMISRTEIKEIVYQHDHNPDNSTGYDALVDSGKKLTRKIIS